MINNGVNPIFLNSVAGKIFTLYRKPSKPESHQGMVILSPFADEMNKSRHMLNLISRRLCDAQYHVIMPDLFGTGDSQGDFKEANWEIWLADVEKSIQFLEDQGVTEINLFTQRTGALLAADIIEKKPSKFNRWVMWHPVIDGNVFLNQFLRMRLASGMIAKNKNKETTKDLIENFRSGQHVEVAGYDISPQLGLSLKDKSLKKLSELPPRIIWIDLIPSLDRKPPVVNANLAQTWNHSNTQVRHETCVGDAFWSSVESVESPQLVDTTLSLIGS